MVFKDFDTQQVITISAETFEETLRLQVQTVGNVDSQQLQLPLGDVSGGIATTVGQQQELIEYIYTLGGVANSYKTLIQFVDNELRVIERANIPNLPKAAIMFSRVKQSSEEIASFYSQANKDKLTDEILKAAQIIEPRLANIELIYEGKRPILYGDTGSSKLMPLALMGDGLVRLITMLIYITYTAPHGIVLFDEIENGLHFSVMTKVWQVLDQFSHRHNVQIFATTHSNECIRAAQEAFLLGTEADFRYHRLDRLDNGEIEAVTFSKVAIDSAIDFNLEVR